MKTEFRPGIRYRHHSGIVYELMHITNKDCKWPETAVYFRVVDGKMFSRPLTEFIGNMVCIDED